MCLIYLVQCGWFIRTQSLTYDEPVDIAAGLDAWRHDRFGEWNDHTPLARLWCTIPLLAERWQITVQPLDVGWLTVNVQPDPQALAARARGMNVLLGLILAGVLWATARRMFSEGAANLALAFFAFSPSMIANFSVATTDGAAAMLIFAASAQLMRWRKDPSIRNTVLTGVVLGLMLLAKFSTPVMFVLAVTWMLVLKPEKIAIDPRYWNWGKVAAVLLLATFVVWAGYFFHVSRMTQRDHQLTTTFANRPDLVFKPVSSSLNFSILVPAGEYLEGFRTVVRHNRRGMPGFFLGDVTRGGGWKSYYPAVIVMKWPVLVLMIVLAGVGLALRRKLHAPNEFWIMASFPVLYLALAIFSKFDLGERHILTLYPFALLLTGAVWQRAREQRWGAAVLVLLTVLNAADTLRYAPAYLSYFTPLVRSADTFRYLTDSNLDWGQGLLALQRYEREHPDEDIRLAYFGSVDPALYGLRARPLAENEPATGTIVVSATNLSGQYLKDSTSYRWLLAYKPTEILDHSLLVFKIPPAR